MHLKYGDDIMATIDIAEKCCAEQKEFENDP